MGICCILGYFHVGIVPRRDFSEKIRSKLYVVRTECTRIPQKAPECQRNDDRKTTDAVVFPT